MEPKRLSGEEALAHGAWEAGVCVATGYPGSPSTRFLEHLAAIARPEEVYCEWSANEKVALEIALGASMAGRRSCASMKSVGLNVAMDPLMVANLGGVSGGLVILLGDDPGAWGSQNEQDSRLLVRAAGVPLLEFSTPQEAYGMIRDAFSISERFEIPVVIRETRSSAGLMGPVEVIGKRLPISQKHFLEMDPWKFFPENPSEKHRRLHRKISKIGEEFSRSPYNQWTPKSKKGILAVGSMAQSVELLLKGKGGEGLSLFRLGTIDPLPKEALLQFFSIVEEVLVVEELQPFVEGEIRRLAQRENQRIRILGKETGHLPAHGELRLSQLREAVREALGLQVSTEEAGSPPREERSKVIYKPLPPACPFFRAFEAFSRALPSDPKERPIFVGDDGCLTRLRNAPFSLVDCKFCMGSSIGIASGLYWAGEKRKIVVLVGDSSLFHTALPAYLNAVASGVRMMLVVLDNRCTAMTGCQANPGTDFALQGREKQRILIQAVLQSPGTAMLRQVDAFGDPTLLASAFQECLEYERLAVLLVSGPCPNLRGKIC